MKRFYSVTILAFLLFVLCLPCSGAPELQRGVIKVHVKKLQSEKGQVILSLFNSPDGFPGKGEKAFMKAQTSVIKDGAADVTFVNVPYGTYAVGVLHDENSNGRMDKKYIFIPAEGVGTSRDAKSTMGPPKYKDAQFELNTPAIELTVNMNYM